MTLSEGTEFLPSERYIGYGQAVERQLGLLKEIAIVMEYTLILKALLITEVF